MNSAWSIEFTRLFMLAVGGIIFGFVSGAWVLAVLAPSLLYIVWMLVQIRSLEVWVSRGAKTDLAPDSSGIWQLVVQQIHRMRKQNDRHKGRLKSLARRFESTIAALPEATIVLDEQLEIEWTNQASLNLLAIDKKRDLGLRFDNLIRNPQLQQLLQDDGKTRFLEIESPVDSLKTLMISCVEFGDNQKLITARDISQRRALQKLRKDFIANASHELRTPLTVVSGYLEILGTESCLPDNVQKIVSTANQQAGRMQIILDDLLTLSKLEEKQHDKNSGEVIDVSNLLKRLVEEFEQGKDGLKIKMQVDAGLKIKAQASEVYSLVQNLLSNALKYSPVDPKISLSWKTGPEGQACLQVRDKGEGIAPEHLSRLTERFYRVNLTRKNKVAGTGLGLSIVKHILENHGGFLGIESEVDKGSVFSACFPQYRVVP